MDIERHLLTIEFRYSYTDKYGDRQYETKEVTIGVYNTFEDACIDGNNLMENLESKFKLHVFPNGRTAKKERFSKNGGCFGLKNRLITNLAYLKTPFDFYAQIKTLNYGSVDSVINEIVTKIKTS